MNRQTKPKRPTERVRIYDLPAVRLRKLSEKSCVTMDRLAQMAVECGIAAVEKRFN